MNELENLIFHPLPSDKRFVDLTGEAFGRLAVLGFAGWRVVPNGKRLFLWHCRCECGSVKILRGSDMKNGDTTSCGCFKDEQLVVHGHGRRGKYSLTFKSWRAMISRMTNPSDVSFESYSGRGITIDPRWLEFENFLADMDERPSAKHSIERTDNDGNYTKENCKWALPPEQARNKRSNVNVGIDGVSMCVSDWCVNLGVNRSTIGARIHSGMSPLQALLTPVKGSAR